MPTIQAEHTVDKCVPEVGIDGPLLGGTDLGGIATRGFMTRCSCGCGNKTRIQNKNPKGDHNGFENLRLQAEKFILVEQIKI